MKKKTILILGLFLFLMNSYMPINAETSQQDIQRYSAYYSNGMQFLKNQQYSSAITEFRKVLRFSPYDETIQSALANAYLSRGDFFKQSTKEYKKALTDYKSAYFYAKYWNKNPNENLLSLASQAHRNIVSLEKKLNIAQTIDSRLQSAKTYKFQGELASSGYDFELLKNSQYKEVAYENLGNIYKNLNNLAQGMNYIQTSLNLNPKNPKLHFMYGVMLDEAKNFEASIEHYNLALQYGDKSPELMDILKNKWIQNIANNPSDAQGYINLGAIYQKQGDYSSAREQYHKAYQLNPDDETILYNVASMFIEQKNYIGAIDVYDKILNKNPNKIEVIEYKAEALKTLKKYEDALVEYNKILALNPNNQNAKANKEDIIFNHFSGIKLQQYLAQQASENQNNYEAQFNYALELHKNKNYTSALKYYKKALSIQPTKEEVYLNIAQIYMEEKNYTKANEICQKGLLMLPNSEKLNSYLKDVKNYDMSSKYNEATALFEQKQYKQAIEKYMQIQNKTKEVNMAIASCYYSIEDYKNAIQYYNEVLKENPNELEALENSAYAYYSLNDYVNAKLNVEKIIALDKSNNEIKKLLNSIYETEYSTQLQEAISLYEQGQFEKSYALIKSYLSKKPNDEYAMYYRGLNLEEMKQTTDAMHQYKSLISKRPNFAPAYYSLAIILDNNEKYSEAVDNYEKFISLKGNEKDEMVNFSINRAKELKNYLKELNASK